MLYALANCYLLMASDKHCDFFLLRYVPDVVEGVGVPIGIILLEEGPQGFTGVRFARNWERVRQIDPAADIELLSSYEAELQRLLESRIPEIINYRGPMSRRDWFLAQVQHSLSGAIQLDSAMGVQTASPADELVTLAKAYLDKTRHPSIEKAVPGRRAVYGTMRGAFEKAGVWNVMLKDIKAATYTHPGDPFRVDCGYRADNVIHLFHALSLAADVNSAKVLAFTYSEMREGLHQSEHVMSDLTAITEDELDPHNEAVAFALATLLGSDIAIDKVGNMPQIAERARIELKL